MGETMEDDGREERAFSIAKHGSKKILVLCSGLGRRHTHRAAVLVAVRVREH